MTNNTTGTEVTQASAELSGLRITVLTGMSASLVFLLLSNVFFIICITRCSLLQTAGNVLLVNLAVADLIVGVFGLPSLARYAVLGSTEIELPVPLLEVRSICLLGYFIMSGKSKGSNVNISLVESGDIITDHQTVSNVFNDYFVDVTADIGKPDSIEAGHTVSDITGVYSNHESVSYV